MSASCEQDRADGSGVRSGAGGAGGEADTGGATAGEAGAAGAGEGGAPLEYPERLSETGLYRDLEGSEALAEEVVEYRPRFELWSDGATKRRFLSLPLGSQIDTSDMDYWVYPVGTRVWKEFTREGTRIETRLLEKRGPNDWLMIAYRWDEDQTDAVAVPDGVRDANRTDHDIPNRTDCKICHQNMPDRLLGVSAVQLSREPGDASLLSLASLAEQGRLSEPPDAPLDLPGDELARAALGYLHANCGNCHHPRSSAVFPTVDLDLWLRAGSLAQLEDTPAYLSAVDVRVQGRSSPELLDTRIVPGSPEQSAIIQRMSSLDPLLRMPPVASERIDEAGVATVAEWIETL